MWLVQDRAFISGNCLVNHFVRVWTLALMQGGSAISKDLPPFTIARGDNWMWLQHRRFAGVRASRRSSGWNCVCLSRFVPQPEKFADGHYRSAPQNFRNSPAAKVLLDFVASAKRGLCSDNGRVNEEGGQA